MQRKILVWHISTRLFHWSLVLLLAVSITTGLIGDMDWMQWHVYTGYTLLVLMLFRVLMGLVGTDYGRFNRLSLSPRKVVKYLQRGDVYVGHNPLGSWAVVLMLVTILLQIISGFLATDDFFTEGPWVAWADEQWISLGGVIHANAYRLLLVLVALHLAAIIYYRVVKKQALVAAMITGYKQVDEEAQHYADVQPAAESSDNRANKGDAIIRPLFALVIALVLSVWLITLA